MSDESPADGSDAPRNGVGGGSGSGAASGPGADSAADSGGAGGTQAGNGSTAALVRALNVPRNVALGLATGVLLAAGAYAYRVFELAGPVVESRAFPVLGPGGYFLMLAFVLAVTVGMLVAALLTAGSAYRLIRRSNRESDRS